jgi:CMP-N-acetylneuraminic acid synthetase
LGGKPLVAHTIEAAIDSKCFSKIVLSTDDSKIARLGEHYSKVTIDKRPDYLATSNATALNTLLEYMGRHSGGNLDTIALMLPTCPLRTSDDIKGGFQLYKKKNVDSVISVTSYSFPYEMSLTGKRNGKLTPFFEPSPLITGNTRSQDQKEYYHPNGAFYIAGWSFLLRNANFFKGRTVGYYMEPERSFDIDYQIDLDINRLVLKKLISSK